MRLGKFLLCVMLLIALYACGGGSGTGGSSSAGTGGGGTGGEGTSGGGTDGSGTGGGGAGGAAGSTYSTAADECVQLINQYRASLGLPPYQKWADAEACTDGEAKNDAEMNKPHGSFGSCGEWAQNTCPGWSGNPESMIGPCLALMWAEGPGSDFSAHGHYIDMSSTRYTQVACGFYVTPEGKVWTVQDFK